MVSSTVIKKRGPSRVHLVLSRVKSRAIKSLDLSLIQPLLLFIISTVFVVNSLACQFDMDCQVGSRCVKSAGNIYGTCQGGLNPGNSNDATPVTDPLILDQTVGNTCQFDIDCGISNKCLKESGYIKGVCVSNKNTNQPNKQFNQAMLQIASHAESAEQIADRYEQLAQEVNNSDPHQAEVYRIKARYLREEAEKNKRVMIWGMVFFGVVLIGLPLLLITAG